MAQLFRTSRENNHSHLVYLLDDGTGVSTESKKHNHIVENGVLIGEDHSHELVKVEPKPNKAGTSKENDKISKVMTLFKEWKTNESDSREKGKESENYVLNKQWKDDVKSKLKGEERATLTLNHIAANVQLLSGIQRQNRTDIRYLPVEDGDSDIAEILTALVKNITEQSNYPFEETYTFLDQIIVGRGFFHIYVDRSKNLEGDIIIERYPWDDVYLGAHEKFDLSDLEGLIKAKWFSKEKIKQLWPAKADDIQRTMDDISTVSGDVHTRKIGDQYSVNEGSTVKLNDSDFTNLKRKEFRVMELWEKEFKNITVIVDAINEFYYNAEENGLTPKEINSLKALDKFSFVPRQGHRMRKTIVAGGVLLENKIVSKEESPFNDFSLVPVYALKKGDMFIGKVEYAKDPQNEVNKRHSQIADILNRVASFGWFYDDETFNTPQDADNFRKDTAKAGFVSKLKNTQRPPAKVEGVKFPGEIASFMGEEERQLSILLNINPEMRGFQGGAESGIAIQQKNRQGLLGNEYLFDNLSFAKKNLGRKLVALIQEVYTPERIVRILENANERQPIEIGGQPFESLDRNEVIRVLTETDLTKYDVVVSESPFNATKREADFVTWAGIANNRPEIPLEFLLELSDLPNKDKYLGMVAQQRQQEIEIEQGKQNVELQKTAMANQPEPQEGML
jgi:hypothetical protein